ncbi:MAG: hypothetical protein FWC10_03705 [Lentimicrobiaceae bacterium]|nr:hypothetical protein [Lentimicrobiaceae bacterium]
MKPLTILILAIAMMMTSCSYEINRETELLVMIDITDASGELFRSIDEDLRTNFGRFLHNANLGRIEEHERFKLMVTPIWTGPITISTASIEMPQAGMSLRAVEQARNPLPLLLLMRDKLDYLETQLDANHFQSSILESILRSILQLNPQSERSVMLVNSDLMHRCQRISFYNRIPRPYEVRDVIANLDPVLLRSTQNHIRIGAVPEIVINLKQKRMERQRDLRLFYEAFFRELGINGRVYWVDNLTQNPGITL